MPISRRLLTLGGVATVCRCMTSSAKTLADYGGCIYSQSANIPGSNNGTERFPGIRRGIDNAELALGPIVVELAQLFQIMPHLGFYDDSKSCSGNAAADRRSLFPVVPNLPFKVEGTIVLGTKLFNKLSQYKNQTAAIAAVCPTNSDTCCSSNMLIKS